MDIHIPPGAPPDLFITDRLDIRPLRQSDYMLEGRAIQELAFKMGDEPGAVLPQYVDLALVITGAVTGGVSLWESERDPGTFRWHYLRGRLAAFEGSTTPRNFSPCGITLDRNAPVLALHPERVYTWLVDAHVVLPEALLVPLYLGGSEPLGTLWVVSESEGQFNRDDARLLAELSKSVGSAVQRLRQQSAPATH